MGGAKLKVRYASAAGLKADRSVAGRFPTQNFVAARSAAVGRSGQPESKTQKTLNLGRSVEKTLIAFFQLRLASTDENVSVPVLYSTLYLKHGFGPMNEKDRSQCPVNIFMVRNGRGPTPRAETKWQLPGAGSCPNKG